jgi:NADH:ubiquinone oxidoreductase subunit 6 (subunit J)
MDPMVTPGPGSDPTAPADPVVVRRAEIARWVGLAKRVGYGLLLLAIVAFAVAAIAGFPNGLVTVTVVALIAACVVLPVPIVMGYGLRAAEREDRDEHARRSGVEPPRPRQ